MRVNRSPLTATSANWNQKYILTLNIDRIEHCHSEVWYYEFQQSVAASFNKSNRFLKTHYQET